MDLQQMQAGLDKTVEGMIKADYSIDMEQFLRIKSLMTEAWKMGYQARQRELDDNLAKMIKELG
jgi:methyl coenzyme M reductase subunit D